MITLSGFYCNLIRKTEFESKNIEIFPNILYFTIVRTFRSSKDSIMLIFIVLIVEKQNGNKLNHIAITFYCANEG